MKKIILSILVICPIVMHAQFDGIVGTAGCKAIHCKDARIIEWALNCEVVRGYQNIAKPQDGYASYGTENAAIGRVEDGNTGNAVSLGDSGVAILTFQTPIVNGEGYDFAVFENSLSDDFLELAFVEVSSDGMHYFRFPATSNTPNDVQIGNSGSVDATLINNLAGKYRVGWGTPFDLEELPEDDNLDKNNILYIKIIDVIGTINPLYASLDAQGNIINDPYPTNFPSSGFDLTGVGVLNNKNNTSISQHDEFVVSVYPNPCNGFVFVYADECDLSLYNSLGQLLHQQNRIQNTSKLDMSAYPEGVYFIHLQNNQTRKSIKIIKQ